MNHKLYIRGFVYFLLLVISVACSPKSTQAPLANTLPPPTNTVPPPTDTLVPPTVTPLPPTDTPAPPTETPLPPTNTPTPTPAGFVNQLIYDIPEMYSVTVQTAEFPEGSAFQLPGTKLDNLPMYIFYPPGWQGGELLPAVILPNTWDLDREDDWPIAGIGSISNFESWGRMIAANGLIAIAYETKNPNDLDALVKYIQESGSEYGIDATRLGLFGTSGNGWLVGSFSNQENREYIKFVVYFYSGVEFVDSPWYQGTIDTCKQFGCYFAELPEVSKLRSDLPTFLVLATMDYPSNRADSDYYLQKASEQGVPMTVVKFENAVHGFDFKAITQSQALRDKGSEIIQQAIDFMKAHAFAP